MRTVALIMICILICMNSPAQSLQELPLWNPQQMTFAGDWLIDGTGAKANLYRTDDNHLVISNGIVARTFAVTPNGATVGLDLLSGNESFIRSVRPEAEIEIDGMRFSIGGLTGQPIHNYLLPAWLEEMEADPAAFGLAGYSTSEIKERFPWKKRMEWMPKDMPWPLAGKELTFQYRLDDTAITLMHEKCNDGLHRKEKLSSVKDKPEYLKQIIVEVHYELYDAMPLISKWIRVVNGSAHEIVVNTFKSEILALTEAESAVDSRTNWLLPNLTIETDYNFGGMTNESVIRSSIAWNIDSLYTTQVCYQRNMPCLLEAYPKKGPAHAVQPGGSFESFRTWELIHDSRDRERKGLEYRRMMRALAPWSTENPILMHVRSADEEAVKKAIDQCAVAGFEMVIMTFGSGFNLENESPEYLQQVKSLADYAHSRGIALGGYSLLASRKVGGGNDVLMPEGRMPTFGNSPCLGSEWGIDYFRKLY
ncbi:MAG: alpha-galactosidase, partial [Bacteroidales bacterium]|nr:alpha-galactosidase [Bacteroidales bacterium]